MPVWGLQSQKSRGIVKEAKVNIVAEKSKCEIFAKNGVVTGSEANTIVSLEGVKTARPELQTSFKKILRRLVNKGGDKGWIEPKLR